MASFDSLSTGCMLSIIITAQVVHKANGSLAVNCATSHRCYRKVHVLVVACLLLIVMVKLQIPATTNKQFNDSVLANCDSYNIIHTL